MTNARAAKRLARLDKLREDNGWTYEDIARITASSASTVVSWFRTPGTASARTVPESILRLLECQAVLGLARDYIQQTSKRLNEAGMKRKGLDTLIPEIDSCLYYYDE